MSPLRYSLFLLPALFLAPARADFSYHQISRMTGGQLMQFAGAKAQAPTESTVAVKGSKMVHATTNGSMIIDVEAQTITHTNNDQKTFYVMTFEEMRNMVAGNKGKVDVSDFKIHIEDGQNAKTLLGHDTHDKIMTITSTVTDEKSGTKIDTVIHNDIYVAHGISGAEEMREFYKKASGFEWVQGGMPGANRPEMMKAMSEAYKSAGSLDGLPLLTVMTIDGAMPGMPQMSGSAGSGANPIAGKLAGLAAIMAKRRQQQSGTPPPANGAPGSLMQMTMEVTSYSDQPVDASLFQIPAGYTKTAHDAR